ncbi:MAG: MBOAT family protein [Prolixibacteraceae bacterium]|jgi:alginate O-acetyltransferase complex protein AlgI|nr:MBOAT family protein [Prolixibacteraceae bacterium]MBT6006124.1 MBOAT family protein [Prolixibacteraceae bacterium]MBT6998107.1 MBOAT family protein [Prolixibacteraceae bacterium]MBT7396965.1 MBOAT family protein [Prolixibacteraceae bacterium]
MVFSSILFLYVFLPVFLLLYHIVGTKLKNYILLAASLIFYAWGAPKFIFFVVGSLVANFYVVRQLYLQNNRKLFLILSVIINLGLLVYFKYANFFVDNVNFILETLGMQAANWTKVALPIGISFFTFQSLTYTIDVYRNVHKPLDKLTDYLLYILMFPQLIAGPIVRFNTVADDITDRKANETIDNKLLGVYRFVIGLSKKILIANVLGEQVDAIYSMPLNHVDSGIAWIAIVAYSFQIYFDFSGYSDMAIGLGKIVGFKFPENFDNPYTSQNITEFWRRWHITLGQFMKYYLYIPLGGNRVSTRQRLYFNLGLVFLLSGLWHGASWNFVIWGAWHGLFLILDRVFLVKLFARIGKIPRVFITYIIVLVGWVFFRIENFNQAIFYIKKMFSFQFEKTTHIFDTEFLFMLIIGFIFSFITLLKFGRWFEKRTFYSELKLKGHLLYILLSILFLLICSGYITATGFNPFIYFRF